MMSPLGRPLYRKGVIMMAFDPLCGMKVDQETAAATHPYKGKTYYFCAVGCKDRFIGNIDSPKGYSRKKMRDPFWRTTSSRRETRA
jgi:YHS domain-containing protein